jgi:hypothetical protein
MENLSKHDWFYSIKDGVALVHYMNLEVFNLVPQDMKIYFAASETFDPNKYVQVLEE